VYFYLHCANFAFFDKLKYLHCALANGHVWKVKSFLIGAVIMQWEYGLS
jgi:hypothetical protein